eukprot:TRINITY_DN1239_c0_g1_i1.p1 TRINITY_DN1239_c0_g1~~TRINITY_DN1239_c0_g1_i1.p1  ORF type:complete len:480 (+),score=155.71 TRINITY_DN1239_c0_g1_i1:28-1467(+)
MSKAEQFKNEANKLFGEGKYPFALSKYNEAHNNLTENEKNLGAIILSNRSLCNLKLENFGSALMDSEEAIKLDGTYAKGYYRKGQALFALRKYKEAKASFHKVVQLQPKDKDARDRYDQCQKEIKRILFEKAIEQEEEDPFKEIDLNNMKIDSSYAGPRIKENGIDSEFVVEMIELFKNQKKIPLKYLFLILIQAREVLTKAKNVVEINIGENGIANQVTVCGDTHGQFYDLANIFKINGLPSEENPYLFNGDFVDRGSFSAETVITLLAFKIVFPHHFFLSRGNHETKAMNKMYGFEGEIREKYGNVSYDLFTAIFNALPLAHTINKKVFICHGGLFEKDGIKVDDINKVNRFNQPPESGIMNEILWSDPSETMGRSPSKRGTGVSFGPDVVEKFLNDNNLDLLVRSHEVKEKGYYIEPNEKCITIFSAPNYCDSVGNLGAFIIFKEDLKPNFVTFEAVPHPNIKPMAYSTGFSGMGF